MVIGRINVGISRYLGHAACAMRVCMSNCCRYFYFHSNDQPTTAFKVISFEQTFDVTLTVIATHIWTELLLVSLQWNCRARSDCLSVFYFLWPKIALFIYDPATDRCRVPMQPCMVNKSETQLHSLSGVEHAILPAWMQWNKEAAIIATLSRQNA